MKSTRRFIALILALCIVCTLLSVTAFAEGGVIDAVELVNVVPAELGGTITEPALTVPEGANYEVYHQSWNKFDYETGIFEEHDTALCQKRQRLCQIDDLSQGEILPLIEMGIHFVAVLTQCLTQTGRVLVLQITFLSVEQVDLFEIAGFDVFIDPLHK